MLCHIRLTENELADLTSRHEMTPAFTHQLNYSGHNDHVQLKADFHPDDKIYDVAYWAMLNGKSPGDRHLKDFMRDLPRYIKE